ncbi:MAG: hypothetical protein ACR2Q4_08335, partial [Geminicoccaceae bacterium]
PGRPPWQTKKQKQNAAREAADNNDRKIIEEAQNQPRLMCEESNCSGIERTMIDQAKALTADMLRDPESARFRSIFVTSGYADEGVTVCGLIQGRNGFGGYAQRKVFSFDGTRAQIAPSKDCTIDSSAVNKAREAQKRIEKRSLEFQS